MTPATRVLEASLDLLWSQWSTLGVPGVRAGDASVVASPVDLVLFTPGILEDRDARLAALVQAWCAAHGDRVFGARELAARREALPEPARDAFDAWTAVLRAVEPGPWPAHPARAPGPPIGDRPVPLRADRPGAVQLRARSLFGVGVRADLACALLEADAKARVLSSPDVAHLGHTPRAVQLTLAALEAAGVVRAQKQGRTYTYALPQPGALADLLDARGLTWVPWHHALRVTFHLVALAAHPSADGRVQQVRAHAVADVIAPAVHALHGLPPMPLRPGDPDAAERLLAWGADVIGGLARTGSER
jgi:hypothetical protein